MWITPRRLRKRTSAALLLFPNIPLITEQKSGQFTCYKTGQFYLLLTGIFWQAYFGIGDVSYLVSGVKKGVSPGCETKKG